MMRRFGWWFVDSWRQLLVAFVLALLCVALLAFQLGSLTGGISKPELEFISSTHSGQQILKDPLFLPQKFLLYTLQKLGLTGIWAVRAPSVLFAFLAVASLFLIMKRWFSNRVAYLGSGLFLTSSWLLGTGRLALPDASFLLILPLLWLAFVLSVTKRRELAFLALCISCALVLYIPGFVWFILMLIVWQFKNLRQELGAVGLWARITGTLLAVIILTPLAMAIVRNPIAGLSFMGLPNQLVILRDMPLRLLTIAQNLLLLGPRDPVRNLGGLPLLDVFAAAMAVFGLYGLRYNWRLTRARLQIGAFALLYLLIASGGPVTMSALLPLTYLFVAGGVAFLLQQWFTVFPRNPFARNAATTLVSVAILLVAFYHINRYFIAWPQAPATRNSFRHSLVQ